MTDDLEAAERVGVKFEWIGQEIGRIPKARDHHRLPQIIDLLRECIEDMSKQLNVSA